jgi:SAM-dependent methyltransferase
MSPLGTQRLLAQPGARFDTELFERRIREYATSRPGEIQVLEAGCGRRWSLDLTGVAFRITGIDVNADAMRMRLTEAGDLDAAIVGDLRMTSLPAGSYDVVFSSFVLEHIAGAEQALDRLIPAIRPGGLLLLRIPDRDSVYGFATRHSPYWLRVQYKRRIKGAKRAGTAGRGPFPPVYDKVVSWRGMTAYCQAHGLEIVDAYSSNFYLHSLGRFAGLADRGLRLIARISGGRLTGEHNNLALVIRAPGGIRPDGCALC